MSSAGSSSSSSATDIDYTGHVETTATLARVYDFLQNAVGKAEEKLNKTINTLNSSADLSQQQLLALQSQIQAWSTFCSTATGLLRAVGDALKSTSQNVR